MKITIKYLYDNYPHDALVAVRDGNAHEGFLLLEENDLKLDVGREIGQKEVLIYPEDWKSI